MTRIALDAMGGDHAPGEIVVGAVESAAAIAAALVAKMRGVNGVEVFAGVLAVGGALSLIVHIVCCRAVFPGVRLRLSCPAARLREAAAFLSWGTLSSVGNAVKYRNESGRERVRGRCFQRYMGCGDKGMAVSARILR